MSNTITAYFKGRKGVAESLYQNDYGMVMVFDGIELPAHFDCYFSIQNQEEAVPGVGVDNRVAIPNSVLANPGKVEIHIPLHTGSSDSEVEYVVYFRVIGRARPVDDGTPAQMTAIEQALALLQNPITNIEQIVNEALDFTGDTFDEMQAALDSDQAAFQESITNRAESFESAIHTDIAEVENDFANLDAQFQAAVSALTVDSEVQGVRVGDDGKTYTTAGEATRTQFANVKDALKGKLSLGTLTADKYLNANNGEPTYYRNWSCSNYIEVNVGDVLTIYSSYEAGGAYNAFYTSDFTFISSFALTSGIDHVTVPSNARYMRLSSTTSAMQSLVVYSRIGMMEKEISETENKILLDEIAMKNGYYSALSFDWEGGSITHPSGKNVTPDANVIRTAFPRFQLAENIRFVFLNDKYRIRLFGYPSASGTGTFDSGWYKSYNSGEVVTIDPTMYYRMQIALDSAAVMDMQEAIRSILIINESNTFDYKDEVFKSLVRYPLWESGGISATNGRTTGANDVIRTAAEQICDYDIRLKISGNYRFRYFVYASDGTFETVSSWISQSETLPLDNTKHYKFIIATTDTSDIDMTDALQSVLIERIPSIGFWQPYIESKVQTINSYLTDGVNKTAFLFLTDTHWNESPVQLNGRGVNVPLMKYIKDRCNIDYVIHGGDLNSEFRSNKSIARQLMAKPIAMMRSVFDNVLITRGNHDDNIEGSANLWDYVITQADSYSYMFRNTKDVVFGETGTYFYHDIPFEKIRIISLDCIDFPYTNEIDPTHADEKILAYGYKQLQWFCDVLKSTPDGYHIVIYTHAMLTGSVVTVDHPEDSPQTMPYNRGVVARILQAYKNRDYLYLDITGWFEAVHQSYYDGILDGDFTNCSGSIVAVFSGHEHVDCIEEIEVDGTGIGIYNTCTQNSSAMFGDSVISHTYQHPMEIGTTSELVWDMVVIDRANKHVDMIRIGANGANTDVEAFDVRSFDYV